MIENNYKIIDKVLRKYSINESTFYLRNNEDTFILLIIYKHLSEKQENYNENPTNEDVQDYNLRTYELFSNVAKQCENEDENYVDNLNGGLNTLRNSENTIISNLFTDYKNIIDLDNKKENISQIIFVLSKIDSNYSNDLIYKNIVNEYINYRKTDLTSNEILSKLMCKLIITSKDDINDVYDPCCQIGDNIIELEKENKSNKYYLSEISPILFKLSKVNIFLNDIPSDNVEISNNDTLYNINYKDDKFDVSLSIPHFNRRINKEELPILTKYEDKLTDIRNPSSNYIYILDMLYHLKNKGIAIVTLPLNALFSRFDQKIRKYLIKEKNYLDTVIELPSNILKNTKINLAILIFKKNRTQKDIFFMNATKFYEKIGNSNIITEENMENIVNIYKKRETKKHISTNVTWNKIEENDYNINVSRYINTYERNIELSETIINQINENNEKLERLNSKINESLKIIESKKE